MWPNAMEIGFWIIPYFLLVTPAVTVRLSTHIIRSGYDDDSQNYSVVEHKWGICAVGSQLRMWPFHVNIYKETTFNEVWWQCLVLISTTRFAGDVGYRMAKM